MKTLAVFLGLGVTGLAVITVLGFVVAMATVRKYQLMEIESGDKK